MQIYQIISSEEFAHFGHRSDEESDRIYEEYTFENNPYLKKFWKDVELVQVKGYGKKKLEPIGDFNSLIPIFLVSEKFIRFIAENEIVTEYEALPSVVNDDIFYGFNVTFLKDLLDRDKSDIVYFRNSDRIMNVRRYFFKTEDLAESSIFRLPHSSYLYCTERVKELVESSNLRGISFLCPD